MAKDNSENKLDKKSRKKLFKKIFYVIVLLFIAIVVYFVFIEKETGNHNSGDYPSGQGTTNQEFNEILE